MMSTVEVINSSIKTKQQGLKVIFDGNQGQVATENPSIQGQVATENPSINRAEVKIKVFGVGGGGGNVLKRLAESGLKDVDLIAVNTDVHALSLLNVPNDIARTRNIPDVPDIMTIQIGKNLTNGLGTGGKYEIAEQAAKREAERLKDIISGADIIFITAGLGGGTGNGAAPVIAEIAKTLGVLTIGVVTVPFSFEGARKQNIANEAIAKMKANMDALVVVQNDKLTSLPENKSLAFVDAFRAADQVLLQAIRCISELILTTGFINVDFADLTTVFQKSTSSEAILGIGKSNISAVKAVQQALESPLIERSLKGARGIIMNITGGEELTLCEVDEAARYLFDAAEDSANIIFGIVIDRRMNNTIQAMLIATDFADSEALKSVNVLNQNQSANLNTFSWDQPTNNQQNFNQNNIPPVQNPQNRNANFGASFPTFNFSWNQNDR